MKNAPMSKSQMETNESRIIKIAVIVTVYNRCLVTINGITSLNTAIAKLGRGYSFDIYMTDDGSNDGTSDIVSKAYPNIKILQGDGNLYWSGGMRKAWQAAIDSGIKYDYFMWFNDDVILNENALLIMFNSMKELGNNIILSGAFCDGEGNVSYGGKTECDVLIEPNGVCRKIRRLNGNLVLIPREIYNSIGNIGSIYKHGWGDYDYGYRAQKKGFDVYLSPMYVGVVDRHDVKERKFFKKQYSLRERWKMLHSPKESPFVVFQFECRYCGICKAIKTFIWLYYYTLFPKYN